MFVDSIQGSYKDGTESGSTDCRWFSAVPFILRFIIFTLYTSILLSSFSIMGAMILVFTAVVIILVYPFKQQFHESSQYQVIFLLFLASIFASSEGLNYTVSDRTFFYLTGAFMLLFQLLYIVAIILRWARRHNMWLPLLRLLQQGLACNCCDNC